MAIVKYIPKVYSRSQCQEHDFPLNLPHSETKIRIIQRDEWKKEMHKESNLSMPKLTVECEVTSNCVLSKQKDVVEVQSGSSSWNRETDLPWNDPYMLSMASHFNLAFLCYVQQVTR